MQELIGVIMNNRIMKAIVKNVYKCFVIYAALYIPSSQMNVSVIEVKTLTEEPVKEFFDGC